MPVSSWEHSASIQPGTGLAQIPGRAPPRSGFHLSRGCCQTSERVVVPRCQSIKTKPSFDEVGEIVSSGNLAVLVFFWIAPSGQESHQVRERMGSGLPGKQVFTFFLKWTDSQDKCNRVGDKISQPTKKAPHMCFAKRSCHSLHLFIGWKFIHIHY